MKKILTLLFIILFYNIAYPQNNVVICGTFKTKTESKIKIKIFQPIYGYYNMSFYTPDSNNNLVLDNTDSFYYQAKIASPISVRINITTDKDIFIGRSQLVLFPDDSIHLNINLDDIENKESIIYAGSNAAGQKFFNDINYDMVSKYQKVIDRLSELQSNKTNFTRDIDNYIKDFTNRLDTLVKYSKITSAFNNYYKTTYSQLLYEYVIGKFLRNYKSREVFTKKERDSIISYFYSKQPVSNIYSKSSFNSYFYILAYYNFLAYKKLGLLSIDSLNEEGEYLIENKKYFIQSDFSQFSYIEDKKAREDLWALNILITIQLGSPYPVETTITQFKELFPSGKWNKVIDKLYTDTRSAEKVEYVLQMPVHYIDSVKKIETLEKLFNELTPDKPILVDLWASWCGPCIVAFRYNKDLDTFLLKNNIDRLYISLDQEGNKKGWKKAIDTYALGGYHIIAGVSLIGDIKKTYKISKDGALSIPRYMLVSKEKKIILADAISPVAIEALEDQIRKFLL